MNGTSNGGVRRMLYLAVPKGYFNESNDDDLLDLVLRTIAVAASEDPKEEWASKYGTNFENDVFMMHRFCWCERDDCPWCGGCTCKYHYYVDGKEVSFEEWIAFYDKLTDGLIVGTPEYRKAKKEADSRLTKRRYEECDFCAGRGVFATKGAEPGRGAPNFWHKPSGLKVWWYKYIGRDMETNRPFTDEELIRIQNECIESLKRKG